MRRKLKKIISKLKENNKTISTMESCTGGALASLITDISGASAVFKYGAVTYSNEYKIKWVYLVKLLKNILFIVWRLQEKWPRLFLILQLVILVLE